MYGHNKKQLRNLKQFADMTDEEFEEYWNEQGEEVFIDLQVIDEEIDKKWVEFEEDYDLSDLKINDRLVLRNLIRAIISLEELENDFYFLRQQISDGNILLLDRLSKVMNNLRKDISEMQNDLKLTRRIRKDSQEENFATYLNNIQEKARKFYKEKMVYVFCPKCRMLLATIWLLYSGDETANLHLTCNREKCGYSFTTNLIKLYSTDNRNLQDVKLP